MMAIKGIFDRKDIKPLEAVPIKFKSAVIITFLDEVEGKNKKFNWHNLRGSTKGKDLMAALLRTRREDLNYEG